jgi:hypothetical protein
MLRPPNTPLPPLVEILLPLNKRTILSAVIAGTFTALLNPLMHFGAYSFGVGIMIYTWLAYFLWTPDEASE